MIELIYCLTEDMAADLMIKGLAKERLARLMDMLGMRTTTASTVEVN